LSKQLQWKCKSDLLFYSKNSTGIIIKYRRSKINLPLVPGKAQTITEITTKHKRGHKPSNNGTVFKWSGKSVQFAVNYSPDRILHVK